MAIERDQAQLHGDREDGYPLIENMIPGSCRGTVHDRHRGSIFRAAVREADIARLLDDAVERVAPAGTISIHHERTLHASANCRNDTRRPLWLCSTAAGDACIPPGQPLREGRMAALSNRLPLPTAPGADSIDDDRALPKAPLDSRLDYRPAEES